MQADFSIECAANDECLELPWASEDGTLFYIDLKGNPALIANLTEAQHFRELADFLEIANSPRSVFQTAKCDAGFTREMTVEDEPFGTAGKFGSYVDVLFASPKRISFEQNETLASSLVRLLKLAPEMPAAAEFLVRRCFFLDDRSKADGFYITCYVFGYSDDEAEARKHWGIALGLLSNALIEISADLAKQT
jgi:hypothetical protein